MNSVIRRRTSHVIVAFVFCVFSIMPQYAQAAPYVPGQSLYPNCNPPESSCNFWVTPNSVIAYIGDSWVAGNHTIHPFFYYVNAHFPFAGVGYVPVDSYPYNLPLAYYPGNVPPYDYFPIPYTIDPAYVVTKTSTGTWTDSTKTGSGPNLMRTNSTDVATPATKGVTCKGTDFTIYYLKQSGGGSFGYSIDGGATTTVSTASTTSFTDSINISGQTLAQHTILMSVTAAGSSDVGLYGVECRISNSGGVRIDKFGMSGSSGLNWAAANATIWQSGFAQFNPSLVIITLGTNDIVSESTTTYTSSIQTMIANIRAASSTVPIILAPPTIGPNTGPAGDVSAYYPPLQDLARQNGYGYVEVSKFMGGFAAADARGLWADNNPGHMSSLGDQLFANVLVDCLGLTPAPTVNSITGQNPQNIVGGRSITINGTNFANLSTTTVGYSTTTVTIGGVSATNVIFASSSTITATAPANVAGNYDVVVTNYTQSGICSGCMTYVDDTTGPIISTISSGTPTTSGTTITWTTNELSDSQIEYGLTSSYTASTTLDITLTRSHSAALSRLTASTIYHYAVISTDAYGNASTSPDQTFTTASVPVVTPSVSSGSSGGGGTLSPTQLAALFAPNASTTAYINSLATTTSTVQGCPIGYICTPTVPNLNNPSSTPTNFTRSLKQGMSGSDVKQLQIFLNSQRFIVAQIGAGSPGHETNFFGPATKSALMKFQLTHKDEILTPQGLTAPTGFFGAATMKTMNTLMK